MIKIVNLHVRYSWRKEEVLKGVSAIFANRHIVLGPNGSGKTTLFRAIGGLVSVTSGKVLIDGLDVEKIYGAKGLLAMNLSEVLNPVALSAYDNLRLIMDLTDGDIDLALDLLSDLGVDKSILKRRKPWELSSGQLKAYTTAFALASKSKHILLDEPFEQLDPARKAKLIEHMRKHKGVIVINTHETWTISILKDWIAHFIIEGKAYGPISVSKLLEAHLVLGKRDDALVSFEAAGKSYSIVESGEGELLTKMLTLDKIYELALRAP